jgi:hypothetical protein
LAAKSFILFLSIWIAGTWICFGQAVPDTSMNKVIPDSARANHDEVVNLPNDAAGKVYKPGPWQPNPKKSGLYSAILPGSGQLYNRQYWKIPIVYVGVGAAAYFIQFNYNKYQKYRKAYIGRLNNPAPTDEFVDIYSTASLKQLQDGYKKYLDMTILLTGVGYMLQVLDAVVFAHLKNFDVSRDLSLRMQPVMDPTGAGLGLVVHIK